MTLTIQLSPLLEAQLVQVARHQGLTPDAYILKILEDSVAEGSAERIAALFERHRNEAPADPVDDYDLLEALDANRAPGERKLFPPDLKGVTW